MKRTAILASFAATFLFAACNNNAGESTAEATTEEVTTEASAATGEGEVYNVVPAQSEVTWNGKKVAGEHSGNIEMQGGELTVADGEVTGGTFTIDMASITNTDITDEEQNGKLVGHLKSDDFFGVEKYPTATFTITSISPIEGAVAGQPNYNVEGDLTIKDKTNKVSFPATVSVNDNVATAKADVTVDRAKYDVRYGSNSFFDNLGDKAIEDEFTVSFDLTAQK
ncbi:YceI family protein [Pontibacter silvestris]|uniref:YceI family protein n=1 Tax=Pontibacter silvestris TaxID=2305183 RepID=A0ABW4WST1_9BACT|nr:YceI family protein [Pontibacter silvestris]MCC9138892.1 YceI family protein [Pontibacter silvestris]